MDVIIKSGKIISGTSQKEEISDILVSDGKITQIAKNIKHHGKAEVIDAKDLIVAPGLVDMHCHLRDPGDPEDETIASGTRSAALGGFTSIACMANTNPVLDNAAAVKYVISKARQEGVVHVYPIGAATLGLKGERIVEMGRMVEEGAVAFSDDGKPITNSQVMRLAIEYAKAFGIKIISHSEDTSLSNNGLMNEGSTSTKLGLKGIPAIAETSAIERDVQLAGEFGPIHVTHVSTAKSVDIIRKAKKAGVKVTADTCPHYFSLTEIAVEGYNTYAKVNPPLMTPDDVKAIINGLKDGTIDAISTDHAPHKEEKKNVEFAVAASGMVGFETALSLSITNLSKDLSIKEIIEKLTINPAKILGIPKGELQVGADADIVIIDPNEQYEIDTKKFSSRSKNSPFNGAKVKGRVIHTIVSGKIVVQNSKLAA